MRLDNSARALIIFSFFYAAIAVFYALYIGDLAAWTDIYVPRASWQEALSYSYTAWYPNLLGVRTSMHPIEFVNSIFLFFTHSPYLAQIAALFLPWLISSISSYFFFKKLDLFSERTKILFSLFYGFNGFVINQFGATALMFSYAFMPLVILYAYLIIAKSETNFQNIFFFALFSALGTVMNVQFIFTIPIIIAPIFLSVFIFGERKNVFKGIIYFILGYLLYLIFILPISLNLILLFFNFGFEGVTYIKGETFKLFLSADWYSRYFSIASQPFLSLFMIGIKNQNFLYFIPAYLLLPIFIFVFFVRRLYFDERGARGRVPLRTAFESKSKQSTFYFKLKEKELFIFAFHSVLIYSFMIFLVIHFTKLAEWFYNKIFFLKAFEQPLKWSYLIVFPTIILLAFLAEKLLRKYQSKTITIFLVVILFATPAFYFQTKITEAKNSQSLSEIGGKHYNFVVFPPYISEINDYFKERRPKGNEFRALWLPQEGLTNMVLSSGSIADFVFPAVSKNAMEIEADFVKSFDDPDKFDAKLAVLRKVINIKYIVVLRGIGQTSAIGINYYEKSPTGFIGTPEKFIQVFNKSSALRALRESPDYLIYEII